MKKFFTLVAATVMALAVNAKDYTGTFAISITESDPIEVESSVSVNPVETTDDTLPYDIILNNFSVPVSPTSSLTFEKITLSNVLADDTGGMGGYKFFQEGTYTAQITGSPIPGLTSLDITIVDGSCVNDDNLYLQISMSVFNKIDVNATFGEEPKFPKYYTDNLNIDLTTTDGTESFPAQKSTIVVTEQEDGNYTLSLTDFTLAGALKVGTIEIKDLAATETDGIKNFSFNARVKIQPGSTGEAEDWMLAGQSVPVEMTAKMTDDKLYAVIDIDMVIMQVHVVFGSDITSGIDNVTVTPNESGVDEIYDLSGRKLNEMQKGINIVRKADGTTVKVLKK